MGRRSKARQQRIEASRKAVEARSEVQIARVGEEDDDGDDSTDYESDVEIEDTAFTLLMSQSQSPTFSRPIVYSGTSDRSKRRKLSEQKAAAKLTGQSIFQAFGIAAPTTPSKFVRSYKVQSIDSDLLATSLVSIRRICDSLKNKRSLNSSALNIESQYDSVRLMAIRDYLNGLEEGMGKIESSKKVASVYIPLIKNRSIEWFAVQLRNWAYHFMETGSLLKFNQGKHKKLVCLIDDEDIQLECLSRLRSQKPSKRTARLFRNFINEEIIPNYQHSDATRISRRTASEWLNALNCLMSDTDKRKGSIYVDGHERADVVKYRERFCKQWHEKYLPRMEYYDGNQKEAVVEPELKENERKIVPVFHDEYTFRANEDQRFARVLPDEQILKPKSNGRGLMISEFVCPCHGHLKDPDTGEYARVTLKYGKNFDGYWSGEDVAKQVMETHKIFAKLHGDSLALYIFDNLANHKKVASDALKAKVLNLKDGGKNVPFLREGFYKLPDGSRMIHKMQFETPDGPVQKGLKTILMERGLWKDGMKKDNALKVLLEQEDFNPDNIQSHLEETVKRIGAWIDFVPKFHPEFNFIEMYWGYAKRKVRNECDYEWETLLKNVPEALNSVPLEFMRRAYTKCCRYIDAYRIGLSPEQVEFATKKYKSHRSIPPEFIAFLNNPGK